jgi:protein SCO1/2
MNPAQKLSAFFFIFLAFAGGAVFLYLAMQDSRQPLVAATVLPAPAPLPALSLVDDSGSAYTNANLANGWQVVFFGFTHCPDICPATLQQLAIARKQVIDAGGQFPEILLVSVDPERDSPEVLQAYVANFGDGIRGVTGTLDEVRKFTSAIGIYFEKSGDTENNYSVDHSAAVLLIDDNGEWHSLFSAPHEVDSFAHDIPVLTGTG